MIHFNRAQTGPWWGRFSAVRLPASWAVNDVIKVETLLKDPQRLAGTAGAAFDMASKGMRDINI